MGVWVIVNNAGAVLSVTPLEAGRKFLGLDAAGA